MSNFILREEWDEYDAIRVLALEKIKQIGHDIAFTCKDGECEPEFQEENQRGIYSGRRRNKKTICLDTMEVYDSASAAGEAIGGTSTQVSAVCRGEARRYKGHRFAYYDDYVNNTIPRYKGKKRKAKP